MKNLLNNSGFEGLLTAQKMPSGWYVPTESQPPLLDATEAQSGKCSILFVGDRKSHALRQDVKPPAAAGFIVGGYVKAENVFFGPGEYAYIYGHILYKDRPYTDASHFHFRVRPGTYAWHRVEEKGLPIPKYQIEKVLVTCTAKFASGKIWFDDLFLVEASWRTDLEKIADEADKVAKRLDEAAAAGVDVAASRAKLASLRDLAAKAAGSLPQKEGQNLVEQARGLLGETYQSLSPAAYSAIWGRTVTSRTVEARALFHGLADDKEKIDANLDKTASLNANMLLPSIVGAYEAVYPSRLLPVREGWRRTDYLAYMIERASSLARGAHAHKIEICPYIACFHPIEKENVATSRYADRQELLSSRHPKDPQHEARFPDPANPLVRDILASIVCEIVSRYEVDGVGLDFIRYHDHQAMCYCLTCRQAIRGRFGFDALAINPFEDKARWADIQTWRAEQITATVKAVHDAVKALKPNVKLYACVISDPDYARASFGQDWAGFAQYLDFVVPMNYGWVGLDEGLTRKQAAALKGKALFLPAVGGMPPQHENFAPDDWIAMVNLARAAEADGVAVYSINYLRPEICSLLSAGPFRTPATLPPRITR